MENIVEIKNLSKKYGDSQTYAVEDINISLQKGSIMGLIGRNGAGKTTTIKLMLNLLRKNSGEIKIFGLDSVEDEVEIKDDIGIVFAENHFPEKFTPRIVEKIMKNVYTKWDTDLYSVYLNQFKLKDDEKLSTMSRGMKMKISLAVALAHHPRLLILDEATSGLDPAARADIMDIFYDFTKNGENSIFFSTHITSDLDRIADHITLIDEGRVLLSVSKEELDERFGIVKCKREDIDAIPRDIVLAIRETEYSTEILIDNLGVVRSLKNDFVIDKLLVEDLITYITREGENEGSAD